jgi:hypothetical protein
MSQFELLTIIILSISLVGGLVGWLLIRYINERKEFTAEKDAHAKLLMDTKEDLRKEIETERTKLRISETSRIVEQVERLVDSITELFDHNKMIGARISNVESNQAELKQSFAVQLTTCGAREKILTDVKAKLDRAVLMDRNDKLYRNDRTDREN